MLVALIDDNPTNLAVYTQLLSRIPGVRAQPFQSSADALAFCVKTEPDLVVLDHRMPPPDGLTFIREFAAIRPGADTPIVMLTGDQDREVRHRALELGASDFLTKPADPVEFLARVRNLLALRRSRVELRERAETLAEEVEKATREVVQREEETIHRLMRAAEFRDNETGNHIVRMGRYAGLVGRQLGMPVEDQRRLVLATPMHDIGKVATPDAILLKPGPLTAEEWVVMRQHTTAGHAILRGSSSRILALAAEIAYGHHERWDGAGYPQGLAGDAIPVSARIAAVCDVFDALISERPYKEAWPVADAFAEIAKGAGTHFDPRIAEAFLAAKDDVLLVMRRFADDRRAA